MSSRERTITGGTVQSNRMARVEEIKRDVQGWPYAGSSEPDRRMRVDLRWLIAQLRAAQEQNAALRELVTEAYPGDAPTNYWRMRAEQLGAWPQPASPEGESG